MLVLVTGTGRCGTKTFAAACKHIKNYTSGHETFLHRPQIPSFPDNHIEVAPHLTLFLPILTKQENVFVVHLKRNKTKTIESLVKRASLSWWARFNLACEKSLQAAEVFYTTRTALIDDYANMQFQLENYHSDWPSFCKAIHADVDIARSMKEFEIVRR